MLFEITEDRSPFYGKYIVSADGYIVYKGSYMDYALSEIVSLAWKYVKENGKDVYAPLFDLKIRNQEIKNLSFVALAETLQHLDL